MKDLRQRRMQLERAVFIWIALIALSSVLSPMGQDVIIRVIGGGIGILLLGYSVWLYRQAPGGTWWRVLGALGLIGGVLLFW